MQVFIGQGKNKLSEDDFERRLYILRKADLLDDLSHLRAAAVRLLSGVGVVPHRHLQGHVPGRPARHLLSRPARAGLRERAGARAPAFLDQHVSDLVAGASLPHVAHNGEINTLRGNNNWMAARQASVSSKLYGDDIGEALADLLRGPVRHRLLRQCAGIPGARRLSARARHDDDDPRGLGGQSAHGRRAPRVLRIQRRHDGAMGRPGRDRVHQRPPDRRNARPQRPAAGALSRHPRRPHHHGVRNGRAADSGAGHRARNGDCSRARCCWSISTRAGSFPTTS